MSISNLLANLANGKYDGVRNDTEQNGVSWGYYVDHGTPVKYREGRSRKYFDGEENVRVPGKRTETRYETDEEKAEFLGKYGFLKTMFGAYPEVGEYSAEYYESRKGK